MAASIDINVVLSNYNKGVQDIFYTLRKLISGSLPGIIEQADLPAKMIAYCYGQRYIDMVCTAILSKNGVKLGFYRGIDLSDPKRMLQGTGKISRYLSFHPGEPIDHSVILNFLQQALALYELRMRNAKKG